MQAHLTPPSINQHNSLFTTQHLTICESLRLRIPVICTLIDSLYMSIMLSTVRVCAPSCHSTLAVGKFHRAHTDEVKFVLPQAPSIILMSS